jgi:benzoylformate decarboxylase
LLARPAPPPRALPVPRAPRPRAEAPGAGERMSVAYLLQTLADVRDPLSIVVEEAPSARPVMHGYLPMLHSETFYTMDSGGLGHSMPAAVGIALAKPEAKVIALIGDGSSMYSIQALYSAAQLKLPITFVIVNNGRYAALQDFAPVFGFGADDAVHGTDLPDIDFVALAAGHGCAGMRVSEAATLRATLEQALRSPVPVVVDVLVA